KAGHRRQHRDGMALDQPSRFAQPLSSFRLLGDKHLKRQAGQCARRHDDQMLFVLDISRNLAKQRVIDLMCKAKIETETINPCYPARVNSSTLVKPRKSTLNRS